MLLELIKHRSLIFFPAHCCRLGLPSLPILDSWSCHCFIHFPALKLNFLSFQLTIAVLACLLFIASAIPMPFNAAALPGGWHYNGDVGRSWFFVVADVVFVESVSTFLLVAHFASLFWNSSLPGPQTLPLRSTHGLVSSTRSSPSGGSRNGSGKNILVKVKLIHTITFGGNKTEIKSFDSLASGVYTQNKCTAFIVQGGDENNWHLTKCTNTLMR